MKAKSKVGLRALWRQFLPLSLSDVVMALGDPLMTMTLARLPMAHANIAAVGVAKSLAVFFESPIIMVLHASNALAPTALSRRAMARFTVIAAAVLTGSLLVLLTPPVFDVVGRNVLGLEPELLRLVYRTLCLLLLWPAVIGWRRYFQGLLIQGGFSDAVGRASLGRLAAVVGVLGVGYRLGLPGWLVAGAALMAGLIMEAAWVTVSAQTIELPARHSSADLPQNVRGVWRFYWPLANAMLVIWGGRALLIGIVARAVDGPAALTVWPAAWGLILVVANATRMVQQIIIRGQGEDDKVLLTFAVLVGAGCSLLLLLIGGTAVGTSVLEAFVGQDAVLVAGVQPVILFGAAIPVLVALQNALSGFLIRRGLTAPVNGATWLGTATLLSGALTAVKAGWPGATAAVLAMAAALLIEVVWLTVECKRLK